MHKELKFLNVKKTHFYSPLKEDINNCNQAEPSRVREVLNEQMNLPSLDMHLHILLYILHLILKFKFRIFFFLLLAMAF